MAEAPAASAPLAAALSTRHLHDYDQAVELREQALAAAHASSTISGIIDGIDAEIDQPRLRDLKQACSCSWRAALSNIMALTILDQLLCIGTKCKVAAETCGD